MVNVDVCRLLVVMEFVMAVWNVVTGALITKGFGDTIVPDPKDRVLAARLEVFKELARMVPCEFSIIAFVKFRVLTVGAHTIFWETIRLLT